MSAQHTPGPWFWALDKHNQATSLMRSGSGDYVVSPQSELSDYALSSHEWNDVSEADARLIAAAPNMAAALRQARERLSYDADLFLDQGNDARRLATLEALSVVDAAISLATGESK